MIRDEVAALATESGLWQAREGAAAPLPATLRSNVSDLTEAVRAGDAEAFTILYRNWFPRSYAFARRFTGRDEAFCLDVVHDAMLCVIRKLERMETEAELEAWMIHVLRSTALDRLRAEARRLRREQEFVRRSAAKRDKTLEEERKWVEARIRELPRLERNLLEERFGNGRTLEEAGSAVGLNGNAASGRIRRVLLRLRRAARRVFP